jgi:hypothetical protein
MIKEYAANAFTFVIESDGLMIAKDAGPEIFVQG